MESNLACFRERSIFKFYCMKCDQTRMKTPFSLCKFFAYNIILSILVKNTYVKLLRIEFICHATKECYKKIPSSTL